MGKQKIKTFSFVILNGNKGEIYEFKKQETKKEIKVKKKK